MKGRQQAGGAAAGGALDALPVTTTVVRVAHAGDGGVAVTPEEAFVQAGEEVVWVNADAAAPGFSVVLDDGFGEAPAPPLRPGADGLARLRVPAGAKAGLRGYAVFAGEGAGVPAGATRGALIVEMALSVPSVGTTRDPT